MVKVLYYEKAFCMTGKLPLKFTKSPMALKKKLEQVSNKMAFDRVLYFAIFLSSLFYLLFISLIRKRRNLTRFLQSFQK